MGTDGKSTFNQFDMRRFLIAINLLVAGALSAYAGTGVEKGANETVEDDKVVEMTGNPLFDGWYADPDVVQYDDLFWIFPTTSGKQKEARLDAFSSPDLKNWTKHESVFSKRSTTWIKRCLWAPASVKRNGKYYLFFSANDPQCPESKWWNPEINKVGDIAGIGVAVADRPEGPYKDYLGKPLITEFYNMCQPIDQFIFEYEGVTYIIFGGWGHCNMGILNEDFTALVPWEDGELIKEITPEGYWEAPVMFKKDGKIYFMWSEGNFGDDSYKIAYAIADTPVGPFKRIDTVLKSDYELANGPGHHSVLNPKGTDDWYIIYHRRPIPNQALGHRVTCIERLEFNDDGTIKPVKMTTTGVPALK